MTGYNPSKYYDDGDDRDMEAGFDEIEHEERRRYVEDPDLEPLFVLLLNDFIYSYLYRL
ncbi:hypothetical protein HW132_35190 [Brasilonema sp. CT11]|nr:hypothetical protein [Brasilonema sp. CT11]